jgi:hypothetical protein
MGFSETESGKLTCNLSQAAFKFPGLQKGYYTITVNMNDHTIQISPKTPTNLQFSNEDLFPGFTISQPYDYLAIISDAIEGTSGWSEVDGNPKLDREPDHAFQYTGEFVTKGGANINFVAPRYVMDEPNAFAPVGWFRLPTNNRARVVDAYGDLISIILPIGVSTAIAEGFDAGSFPDGNPANDKPAGYGLSLPGQTKYRATYDLMTYRLRIVEIQ